MLYKFVTSTLILSVTTVRVEKIFFEWHVEGLIAQIQLDIEGWMIACMPILKM